MTAETCLCGGVMGFLRHQKASAYNFTKRYLWRGAALELRTNDDDVLSRMSEYFLDENSMPPHADKKQQFYQVTSAPCPLALEHRREVERGFIFLGEREVFKDVFYRHYGHSSRRMVAWLPPKERDYVVLQRTETIKTISPPLSEYRELLPTRIGREIDYRSALNSSSASFHAGAVKHLQSEAGLLLVGASGAGKTTLLSHLVAGGEFAYVSNDRLVVDAAAQECYGSALPIRLGTGMLEAFPEIVKKISNGEISRRQSFSALRALQEQQHEWGSPTKLELSPREFVDCFKAKATRTARVSVVLVPKASLETRDLTLRRLQPDEVARALEAECTSPRDRRQPDEWIASSTTSVTSKKQVIKWLSEEVPAFELSFNVKAPNLNHLLRSNSKILDHICDAFR